MTMTRNKIEVINHKGHKMIVQPSQMPPGYKKVEKKITTSKSNAKAGE